MKRGTTLLAIALLMASMLLGVWAWGRELYVATVFGALGVMVAVSVLWAESRRAYRMMQLLLESLSTKDYSIAFSEASRRSADIDALARSINGIVDSYKQREMEVQTQLSYLETLLGNIDTALIVTTPEGSVEWANRATTQLLLDYVPRHIDELATLESTLPDTLRLMRPGHTAQLHLRKGTADEAHLVASVSIYTTGQRTLHIYSIRNIREVLEENEMESWQKLIRVLTHEIMNSLTPIISLSETLEEYLPEELSSSEFSEKTENTESTALLRQGLQTIHRRSGGLLEFMKNYRKVALVPQPLCSDVKAEELVSALMPLFISTEHITYRFALQHPDRLLHIDRTQMEQVLINLLKNATEACAHTSGAVVTLTDSIDEATGRYCLHVTDNGPGILPEVQEKIFIPFFTTKPQGSGIGLALSRQIVRLHCGTLSVASVEGCTRFTVEVR
jgi:nitrogen fixation/metabolism regulation signal transduction histidine kinase